MSLLLRNILLGVGAVALLAGIVIGVLWLRSGGSTSTQVTADQRAAVLVTSRPIAAGTLLRETDLAWQVVKEAKPSAGSFVRGTNSQSELVGALARRNLAGGEVLTSMAVLRPNERGFLAATLVPGYRAVTIPVDARQSASGLVLPGDRVDVILVQNLPDTSPARKSVGETVLTNARVVAVGRVLGPVQKEGAPTPSIGTSSPDGTTPQTITLEALPIDAQRLFVAGEIGKLELSLRAIGELSSVTSGDTAPSVSIWAGDVSNALRNVGSGPVAKVGERHVRYGSAPAGHPSGYPPVIIIRGSRGDGR